MAFEGVTICDFLALLLVNSSLDFSKHNNMCTAFKGATCEFFSFAFGDEGWEWAAGQHVMSPCQMKKASFSAGQISIWKCA